MKDLRHHIGLQGEEQARRFLEGRGLQFVAAHYRTRFGEIDLIMQEHATLVFVEVKRRGGTTHGTPEEAVHQTKKGRLVKAALGYVQEKGLWNRSLRFDVVSIGPAGLKYFKSAFSPGREYYY